MKKKIAVVVFALFVVSLLMVPTTGAFAEIDVDARLQAYQDDLAKITQALNDIDVKKAELITVLSRTQGAINELKAQKQIIEADRIAALSEEPKAEE